MGTGLRIIYITDTGEVYPAGSSYGINAVPVLANCRVLAVDLFYLTQNRKPWEMLNVFFSRLLLDETGYYVDDMEEARYKLSIYFRLKRTNSDHESDHEPWEIPRAPEIPTEIEKKALTAYIKEKYPTLWVNSPYAIEDSIRSQQERHKEMVAQIKRMCRKQRVVS